MWYLKLNMKAVEKALEGAMFDTVLMWVNEVKKITPRDPARPPNDPSQPVTWNLKRSVSYEKKWKLHYKIWTQQGQAEYWKYLEFWTVFMEPRSFIRKWLFSNKEKLRQNLIKRFKQILR